MTKEPKVKQPPTNIGAHTFKDLKAMVTQQFAALITAGPVFQVDLDRDLVWSTYLDAFAPEYRQSNTCNCCKSFLRQFGGIVGLKDSKIVSLWDIDLESDEYSAPVVAIRRYVHTLPITGPYLNDFKKCGTDRNPDKVRGVIWEHFSIELPSALVKPKDAIGPFVASARADAEVLLRSINEITPDAVQTVLDLIGQGSLYRGSEFKIMVEGFKLLQKSAKEVPAGLRNNFAWMHYMGTASSICRIRNTSIGTLLTNLSEGMELDHAVRAFESVVAPTNYKRPTALVTPAMVEKARLRLEELGLTGAVLHRRLLTERDLTAENALHVYRPTKAKGKDIFAEISQAVVVNPKSLTKVEEISVDDFLTSVLPTAKSVRALVENSHLPNLVSLVGPQNPNDAKLFKWDNKFSWSYAGAVADSIKERVKAAGGNVTGLIRVSLSWNNTDDLDLHVTEPNGRNIMFSNRRGDTGGVLDVDANGGDGIRPDPCENICWQNEPKIGGTFKIIINQWAKRETVNTGWALEVEYDGEVHSFSGATNGSTGHNHHVAEFTYSKKDGFAIKGGTTSTSGYRSQEKWGIKTGMFQQVKAITLSPNHWGTNVGNKHVFFLLEGCKSDEKARGFYNEFLKQELDGDRKVFEILGSKVEVEVPEGELSGIGFNDTTRNHLICEVEGSFRRTLKIKF